MRDHLALAVERLGGALGVPVEAAGPLPSGQTDEVDWFHFGTIDPAGFVADTVEVNLRVWVIPRLLDNAAKASRCQVHLTRDGEVLRMDFRLLRQEASDNG